MKGALLALVVMPQERRLPLLKNLEALEIDALTVSNCREARRLLETRPRVEVVVTDVSLPDGNWCDVFRFLVETGIPASMVVTSRFADERLWSEVLWRGAYDLLVEPYEQEEVRRVLEGAVRASFSQQGSARQAAGKGA